MITLDELADLMIEIKPDSMSVIERVERGVKIIVVWEQDGKEYKKRLLLPDEFFYNIKALLKQFIKQSLE